jgi:negative regulator of sigma E activity
LAGPSRLGSIAIVTVLSCVVLGAVWSLVLYTLPQNDLASEPTPVSFPPQPATPASPAHTGVPAPPTPEPVSQPVVVREPAPVIQIEAQEHPPVSPCVRRSGGS